MCGVLRCSAVCCGVLPCVAVCYSALQCGAVWCGAVRSDAVRCNVELTQKIHRQRCWKEPWICSRQAVSCNV